MTERTELDDAVDLAKKLLGFKSFRRIDPLNVRLGHHWLGALADENGWGIWRCSIGNELDEPDGELLDTFDDVVLAMASLVGRYASEMYAAVSAYAAGGVSDG